MFFYKNPMGVMRYDNFCSISLQIVSFSLSTPKISPNLFILVNNINAGEIPRLYGGCEAAAYAREDTR